MLFILFMLATANAGLVVEVQVRQGNPINESVLNSYAADNNLSTANVASQQQVQNIFAEACPPGTFSAINSTDCTPCAPGSASNVSAASVCPLCEIGYFASNSSSLACSPCAANTYAPVPGTPECLPCYALAWSPEAAGDCTCNAGAFRVNNTIGPLFFVPNITLQPALIDVAHVTCI